ncbi:MAG TPA: DinB family protein [Pyrinomonadaceae bacterium]|nr:DinB family protein [Pyrinomonadaceae bacterium]
MTKEVSSTDDFLRDFHATVMEATFRLQAITPEQSAQQPSPDKWSIKQVLGHLIDSAANNHQRFVRAQFTDDLVFPGYEQEKWVDAQQYNDEPWDDLLQLWHFYNLHLAHVIAAIPEEKLMQARIHHNLDEIALHAVDKKDTATLDYFVRDYLVHMKHHLDQIYALQNS